MGIAIIGAPNITKIKSISGQCQYPSLIENDRNNTKTNATESTNIIINCLLVRENERILLINAKLHYL